MNLLQEQELELFDDKNRFETSLEVIKEYKLKNYANTIANLINNEKIPQNLLAKCAQTLKELDNIHLIDKKIIEPILNIVEENGILELIKENFGEFEAKKEEDCLNLVFNKESIEKIFETNIANIVEFSLVIGSNYEKDKQNISEKVKQMQSK